MTPPADDAASLVAEAFDELRRFHIYDHSRDEWVMSGCDFGGSAGCVVEHNYEPGELEEFDRPGTLVDGCGDLTVVWEDGGGHDEGGFEVGVVDLETAEVAARAIIDGLVDRLDVERERIRVVSLEAPNEVRYFLTGPRLDEMVDGDDG